MAGGAILPPIYAATTSTSYVVKIYLARLPVIVSVIVHVIVAVIIHVIVAVIILVVPLVLILISKNIILLVSLIFACSLRPSHAAATRRIV